MTPASYRSPKTAVRRSGIAGRGLFADAAIAEGEIVCVKGGHLLTKAAFSKYRGVSVFTYEGATHGFFDSTRRFYPPEAAARAKDRILDFLKERLQ
jgi:dienelactone hydrolase